MLKEIVELEWELVRPQFMIIFLCWGIVLASVGLDLYFGVKKSKEEGVFMHSFGLKQTTKKTVLYLTFMTFLLFGDVMNPFWYYFDYLQLPVFTITGAFVLTYTEYKSVKEKNEEKVGKEIENNMKELYKLLKDNRDVLRDLDKKSKDGGDI